MVDSLPEGAVLYVRNVCITSSHWLTSSLLKALFDSCHGGTILGTTSLALSYLRVLTPVISRPAAPT